MFDDHFEVFLADTPESKKINYKIRYEVYCEEMGFEDKEKFPHEEEIDEYDRDSVHFIVKHKLTQQWVGSMRLILKKERPLPIELNAKLGIYSAAITPRHSVELSRLCVIKEMRRGSKDFINNNSLQDKRHEISGQIRLSRKITFGLIHAASIYCYQNNIHKFLFLTTNALAKVLRKGELILNDIGKVCYHKGERYPFKMDVVETLHSNAWHNDFKRGYKLYSSLRATERVIERENHRQVA